MREIYHNEPDTVPFAPYLEALKILDDSKPSERRIGIEANITLIKKGFIDEARFYGNKISHGMLEEFHLFREMKVPIYGMTPETLHGLYLLTGEDKNKFILYDRSK